MKVVLFTSWNEQEGNYLINALKYTVKNLEGVTFVLSDDVIPESVEQLCSSLSVPVYTYENLYRAVLKGDIQKPDIGLAFGFKKIIKNEILKFPLNGIINFHPAPLPKYKGVSCCCYAIYYRHSKWAVTAHYMDEGIDTGPIIRTHSFDIKKYNTAISLKRINSEYMLGLFEEITDMLASGEIPRGIPQAVGGHYYRKKQLEKDKVINLTDSKSTVDHKIKSMWYPPYHGAYIVIDGEKYTLCNQEILDELGKMYPITPPPR